MEIRSVIRKYEVILKDDTEFVKELFGHENTEYVVDKNVYELYTPLFESVPKERLLLIEATEEKKTIDTALEICERISELSAKRNAVLVSVGGGIIQDITGFVANIMYRGIKWIFVPTTLLAACDSCIGGKTSLNYKGFKNLLGTFYPPEQIYIAPVFFKTLSERDYKSGLGEVVKFNIMSGQKGLENIENNIEKLLSRDENTIKEFVESSLEFKKRFIEIDEFDKGERIKLNFAHTFGHAIEVVSRYEIPHGTAVAIGMIIADDISYKRGYVNSDVKVRSERKLLEIIDIDIDLLEAPESQYMAAIKKDKKQTDDSLTAVLIVSYGEVGELKVVHDVTQDEIFASLEYFKQIYKVGKK